MIQFWEIAASFAESFFGLVFPAKALANQKISLKKNVLVALLLTVVVWFLNQYVIFSVLTSILGIILLTFGTSSIYHIKHINVLPMMGCYMMVIYICDFLSLSFLGVLLDRTDFAFYAVSALSYQRVSFLIISKSLLVFVSILIAKMYFKYSLKRYASVLFYLGEGILLLYMVMRTLSSADIDVFLLWIALFLLNVSGIYSAVQHSIATVEKEGNLIEKKKNEMLSEDYQLFVNNYNHKRVFYHDLENQPLVIKKYLEKKEYKKAEEYMEKVHKFGHEMEIIAYTGIEMMDLILSYKINSARSQGIHVNILAEQIALKLTELEIVAVMSNILDNAIEACQKVEENQKWIQIVIRQVGDISFIKVTNNYYEEPYVENNVFVSQKEEREVHGIGLISVKSIIEKYGGAINIYCENGKFAIIISFFD